MREPLELTFDPACGCSSGLVVRRDVVNDQVTVNHPPTLCACVQSGTPEPRKPCADCGGLAIKDGFCIGCGAARAE